MQGIYVHVDLWYEDSNMITIKVVGNYISKGCRQQINRGQKPKKAKDDAEIYHFGHN